MNSTAEQYVTLLNELLQKKSELLKDILDLSCAQTKVIDDEDIDGLNRLIDEKQGKIDEIDKLDKEFSDCFEKLKSILKVTRLDQLESFELTGAKELKTKTAGIIKVISSISEKENENSRKSKELLSRLGTEIKKINQNKKVSNAYTQTSFNTPSYFMDKKK